MPEDTQVLDDADFRYFEQRYQWLRREHARVSSTTSDTTRQQLQQLLETLNRWSFSLLNATGHTIQQLTTVLPGWHQRRIYELLHISMPRVYAHRFYDMILGHQAILSEREGRDVSLEDAAQNWYTRYHLPAILLLRQNLTSGEDPMQAYFAVMQHKWDMSRKARHEVPLEEALLDWLMTQAKTGTLGTVDPASVATWWSERKPVTLDHRR